MAATPCCLAISTSVGLYLGNQGDLGFQVSVLVPFLLAALVLLLVGLLLSSLSRARGVRCFCKGTQLPRRVVPETLATCIR